MLVSELSELGPGNTLLTVLIIMNCSTGMLQSTDRRHTAYPPTTTWKCMG